MSKPTNFPCTHYRHGHRPLLTWWGQLVAMCRCGYVEVPGGDQ